MADQVDNSYSASRIAVALGRRRQDVQWELRDTCANAMCLVRGQKTKAWTVEALPCELRGALDHAARERGYRSAEQILSDPPGNEWKPPLPLREIAGHCLEKAAKLQCALGRALRSQHDPGLTAFELERMGLADYAREFGHAVSGRYWRDLFDRTVKRAGGSEDWARLELYLDERVAQKDDGEDRDQASLARQFPAIYDYIAACSNPVNPSETERQAIWTLTFEEQARLVGTGMSAKRAKRKLRAFLSAAAPFLASTPEAMLKAYERKWAKWEESDKDAKSIRDGRENNTGNHDGYELPENDRDLLIHRAVFKYRGPIAPAWRDLIQGRELSPSTLEHYASGGARKSYVPRKVMDSVGPEVEILTVLHQGPRAFDNITGYVSRNYEGIKSLQVVMADDFTMNVYFYAPDGAGWFKVTRGQILIFNDFRSGRILGYSIQPDRNYNSLVIRSQCTHLFSEFGVPDVLYFERGIWERAALIKGTNPGPFSFVEVSQGLREFGIRFIHAIRPRSKTVERIGGMVQSLMEAEPGYCGRDERREAPETLRKQIAEVEARKTHPSRYFYSYDQWDKRFADIVRQYNSDPQQGKICAGTSPDATFERCLDPNDPPMQFSAGMRFLLAHDKRPARVTLNGVTIQVGKQKFNYRGKEIAHLVGREALVWFDPENAESLVVTDMDRKNPICVARSQEVSALESLVEPDSETLGTELERVAYQAKYMKARFNVLKTKFELPQRRLLVDAQTAELGQQIERGKKKINEQRQTETKNRIAASKLERETGIAIPHRAVSSGVSSDKARRLRDFLAEQPATEGDPI